MAKLGDRGRDQVTGFEGLIVARTEWLYGCERLGLQGKVDKDGKVGEAQWFDAAAIVVVEPEVVKGAPAQLTGGPARGEETRRPEGR
jgi:hypothetical protein